MKRTEVIVGCGLSLVVAAFLACVALVVAVTVFAPTRSAPIVFAPTKSVVIPSGWRNYTPVSRQFTVSYPPDFAVYSENSDGVTFAQANARVLTISAGNGPMKTVTQANVNEFAQEVIGSWSQKGYRVTRVLGQGIWRDGVHEGFYVEASLSDDRRSQYNTPYAMAVAVPMGSQIVSAVWMYSLAPTDTPEESLKKVTASLRSGR